jgi:hypothetical protein
MDILIPLASIVAFDCQNNRHPGQNELDDKGSKSKLGPTRENKKKIKKKKKKKRKGV